MMRLVRGVILLLLAVTISACSGAGGLNAAVVEQAIALNITQVQQTLNQQLYRTAQPLPKLSISHVSLTQREALPIQGIDGYRVQGTYDVTLAYGDHTVREQHNPFELYLQRQGKTLWALARPLSRGKSTDNGPERQWEIWPLQPPLPPAPAPAPSPEMAPTPPPDLSETVAPSST